MENQVVITNEEIETFASLRNLRVHTILTNEVNFWFKAEIGGRFVDAITCWTNKQIKDYVTKKYNEDRGIVAGEWVKQRRPYINKIKEALEKDFLLLKNIDDISFFRQPVVKDFVNNGVVTGFCKIQNKLFKFKMRYKKSEDKVFLKSRYTSFLREDVVSNVSIEPKSRDNNRHFFHSVIGFCGHPVRPESVFHKQEIIEVVFETEELAQKFLELAKSKCRAV